MKIAIDASSAVREDGTGVAMYIVGLAKALASIAPDDEFFLYYRFSRIRDSHLFLELPGPNFQTVVPPYHLFMKRGLDVAHGPDSRIFRLGKARPVVTLHDVFSLISDEWAPERFRRRKKGRYRAVARKAKLVVCDSESTARDYAENFPETRDRLRVVPLGVGKEFQPVPRDEAAPVLKRLGVRAPYLLHVGNIAARKNLCSLVEAFASLAEAHAGLQLVMAGRLSYGHEEVLEKVSASGLRERIIMPGYVARGDLPALYSGAEAFVFPSFYEGFGLPALEACACGTPVVASSVSSLPEVVGEAGLFFDPKKVVDLAGAIDKLLNDDALRARLSGAGIEQARRFTWERTAIEMMKIYREAVD